MQSTGTRKETRAWRIRPSACPQPNWPDISATTWRESRYAGDTIIVLKNSSPVAELRPLPVGQCSLRSFVELWRASPSDPSFAADLETVDRTDTPVEDPRD